MDRIYIQDTADLLTVATILVKNKYTVRRGKRRRPGLKSYDYYVEFEPNPDSDVPKGDANADEG